MVTLLTSVSSMFPWFCSARWIASLPFISSFNFQVTHIFHKGNQVADHLSKVSIQASSLTWLSSLLNYCIYAHFENLDGYCNYRFVF